MVQPLASTRGGPEKKQLAGGWQPKKGQENAELAPAELVTEETAPAELLPAEPVPAELDPAAGPHVPPVHTPLQHCPFVLQEFPSDRQEGVSVLHVAEQPSPLMVLPSSHVSAPSVMPLPQTTEPPPPQYWAYVPQCGGVGIHSVLSA